MSLMTRIEAGGGVRYRYEGLHPRPDPILYEVAAFLARTGMAQSRLGRSAAGDPTLVFDLRKGKHIRPPLAAQLRSYMAAAGASA